MGLVFSVAEYIIGQLFGKAKYASKFDAVSGITLYDNEHSPCARRVRMTLLEKGILYHKVEVDLLKGDQLTEEYKLICPNKKVPAVFFLGVPGIEDGSLYESNVITEFLDSDAFPGPKLYPRGAWERAQAIMWQDWELGLVDDFVPLMYSNTLPFVLQLVHGSKDRFMASLPDQISPAKKTYWSRVYDADLSSKEELKQHAIACYQSLVTLEKALEGRQFLVGDAFTVADLSVLPRVSMYNEAGLPIPAQHFPNVTAYLQRLGKRGSISGSQSPKTHLMGFFMGSLSHWVVSLGNWRSGRNLQRIDGSVYLQQALSSVREWKHKEKWEEMSRQMDSDTVLLLHCPVYPECWQVQLLLKEKGVKFSTLCVGEEDVVGRWAGSEGMVRIYQAGHHITGIRAVQHYLHDVFAEGPDGLVPRDPLQKARMQEWQAWDSTLGWLELSHLLETHLIARHLALRYCNDLSKLHKLKADPFYQSKYHSILLCFVCGLLDDMDKLESVLKELGLEAGGDLVSQARRMLQEEQQWRDLLMDRLAHLETHLQSAEPFMLGHTLTMADINVFCRLCFLQGLGLVDKGHHSNITRWLQFLLDTRLHFRSVSHDIASLFDGTSQKEDQTSLY